MNARKLITFTKLNDLTSIVSKHYVSKNSVRLLGNTSLVCNAGTKNATVLCNNRCQFNTSSIQYGLVRKALSKIPFFNVDKSKINANAFYLYESVADRISYEDFFNKFSLEDTFFSWFLVTELHIWMLLVRSMAEEEDGRFMRNCIVQALWNDVNTRVKKLAPENPAGVRSQVATISEQFQAALFVYDEGLQSSDKVLAGALWRRFFQQNCNDPEKLDLLVRYVRMQINYLDNLSREQFLEKHQVIWEPLEK